MQATTLEEAVPGMLELEASYVSSGLRPTLARTAAFLSAIGLPVRVVEHVDAWIGGGAVAIEQGELLITQDALESDLLHEGGHLAVLPAWIRPQAAGDVGRAQKLMLQGTDFSDPDSPEAVAAMQCGDPEATAWAWAAGQAIGLDAELIVRDQDYERTGRLMRMMLSGASYAGIQGLVRARWCAARPGGYAQVTGLPAYPRLNRWLQH